MSKFFENCMREIINLDTVSRFYLDFDHSIKRHISLLNSNEDTMDFLEVIDSFEDDDKISYELSIEDKQMMIDIAVSYILKSDDNELIRYSKMDEYIWKVFMKMKKLKIMHSNREKVSEQIATEK